MTSLFAEAMIEYDLEPATFTDNGHEYFSVKGVYTTLLYGIAKELGQVPEDNRDRAVEALACAGVCERDPAEALEYLRACGYDYPVSYIGTLVEVWETTEELLLAQPPSIEIETIPPIV